MFICNYFVNSDAKIFSKQLKEIQQLSFHFTPSIRSFVDLEIWDSFSYGISPRGFGLLL